MRSATTVGLTCERVRRVSGHDEPKIEADVVQRLLERARAATTHAYVPYSSFSVGASLLLVDGSVVSGVNIENASYGLSVCGERVAVFNAASQGHREIRAVAISAPRAPGATPCGACRQVLNEFKPVDGEIVVILDNGVGGEPEVTTLSALLPQAFGPRDLA